MECHKCSTSCPTHASPNRQKLLGIFAREKLTLPHPVAISQIALVGMPNVGKSVLFNALTGTYVTVSNYPGTTVEVSRGQTVIGDRPFGVVDTPGMYSLLPITEEEAVSRNLLLHENFDLVIHVVDAKNLGRMLPLTFQLLEAGLPVLLAVNMMDEAQRLGMEIKRERLERELGIPAVLLTAARNQGVTELKQQILNYVDADRLSYAY